MREEAEDIEPVEEAVPTKLELEREGGLRKCDRFRIRSGRGPRILSRWLWLLMTEGGRLRLDWYPRKRCSASLKYSSLES